MKDVMVVTSQFYKLWEQVDEKSQQWNSYSQALLGWELVVQRVLWDMGYDAHIAHVGNARTEVYERVGPDQHAALSGVIVQHIENAIKTVTLEEALID